MWDIKIYEEITKIELKDWKTLNTTATVSDIANMLNNEEFVVIDWVWFGRYEVKTFREKKIDSIENFILSLSKDVRDMVTKREKEKKRRIWKWFESIWEIQRYIKSKESNDV